MTDRTEQVANNLEDKQPIMKKMPPEEDPLRCGYLVGIDKDGKPVFEIVGASPDIVTLSGLHTMAGKKIDANMEAATGGGWPFVANQLERLVQLLKGFRDNTEEQSPDEIDLTAEQETGE